MTRNTHPGDIALTLPACLGCSGIASSYDVHKSYDLHSSLDGHRFSMPYIKKIIIVGSVNRITVTARVDKSTIYGMRGLWDLTVNSGRVATLKYLQHGHNRVKNIMAVFLGRIVILSLYTT